MDLNSNLIVDVDADKQHIQVVRTESGHYDVINNGTVRHPSCDAESAMRALGFYLNGISYKLEKLSENSSK